MPVEVVIDLQQHVPCTPPAEARTPQPLHKKYEPRTLHEVCGHASSISRLREILCTEDNFTVVCHGRAGLGVASSIRLLLHELECDVREISASVGATEMSKLLKLNSSNILLQLRQLKQRTVYILRDLDALNRPDRLTILKHATESAVYPCIIVSTQEIYQMRCIHFVRPDVMDVIEHLAWIVSMEVMDVSIERLTQLAHYPDVRSAICALEANSTFQTDVVDVEPFVYCLYAKEQLETHSLEALVDMSDAFCYMDVGEFQLARDMFLTIAKSIVDASFRVTTSKQTHVARNAQICNRVYQLASACRHINIHLEDMDQTSFLIRKRVLSGELHAFGNADPNKELKNRALYTIGKRRCSSSEARNMRKLLQE